MSKKTIKILEREQYEIGFPPENALALRCWLDLLIEETPDKCRDSVEVEFEAFEDYRGQGLRVRVFYTREETPAEARESAAALESNRERQLRQARERVAFLEGAG